MLHANISFLFWLALFLIFMPGISKSLSLPTPILEILAGILMTSMGIMPGSDWFSTLASIGFLFLMLQAGMEINFTTLSRQPRFNLWLQILCFALTTLLAYMAALWLQQGSFVALILSTTSLGLVMPALRESGLAKIQAGQNLLIAATIADFFTLLGITFYVLAHRSGLSWQFIYPVLLLAGFIITLFAVRRWAWWYPEVAQRLLQTHDVQELGVRISFALLLIFIAFSELAHIEPVLGAFMGGAVLAFVFRDRQALETKISAIGFGFLIPLFFINVGLNFNISNILNTNYLFLVGLLLVISFAVKIIPCLLTPLWGHGWRSKLSAGVLLSSRLSLIVAAASIGVQENFITEEFKDCIVLLALCTCFLGPTLFRLFIGVRR